MMVTMVTRNESLFSSYLERTTCNMYSNEFAVVLDAISRMRMSSPGQGRGLFLDMSFGGERIHFSIDETPIKRGEDGIQLRM